MSDYPIIFSAPMIRVLLDGRKTQTRRLLKPQPEKNSAGLWVWPPYVTKVTKNWDGFCQTSDEEDLKRFFTSPARKGLPARPGDRLWVREAWAKSASGVEYRADFHDASWQQAGPWRPSIHMPRAASRITLTVTDVRVERLQDISEADARAEGIDDCDSVCGFSELWDSLYGPGSWDANPWVAAIIFTTRMGNIDG